MRQWHPPQPLALPFSIQMRCVCTRSALECTPLENVHLVVNLLDVHFDRVLLPLELLFRIRLWRCCCCCTPRKLPGWAGGRAPCKPRAALRAARQLLALCWHMHVENVAAFMLEKQRPAAPSGSERKLGAVAEVEHELRHVARGHCRSMNLARQLLAHCQRCHDIRCAMFIPLCCRTWQSLAGRRSMVRKEPECDPLDTTPRRVALHIACSAPSRVPT